MHDTSSGRTDTNKCSTGTYESLRTEVEFELVFYSYYYNQYIFFCAPESERNHLFTACSRCTSNLFLKFPSTGSNSNPVRFFYEYLRPSSQSVVYSEGARTSIGT